MLVLGGQLLLNPRDFFQETRGQHLHDGDNAKQMRCPRGHFGICILLGLFEGVPGLLTELLELRRRFLTFINFVGTEPLDTLLDFARGIVLHRDERQHRKRRQNQHLSRKFYIRRAWM